MVTIGFFGWKVPLISCYDNIHTGDYHYFGYRFIMEEAQLIYFIQIVYTNIYV